MEELTLSEVIISAEEIEQITGLDISSTQIGGVYRLSLFSSLPHLVNVVINELFVWLIIIIFILPVVAIALTRYTSVNIFYPLSIGLFLSCLIYSLRWIYLHFKKQELKNTILLLEQIDKHNQVVQSMGVIKQISDVKTADAWLQCSPSILECLNANRESLVCALMMEAIARKNKLSLLQRTELLATVENNLEFITSLSDRSYADEYTYLVNEVLTINLKVTEEMRNLKFNSSYLKREK